MAARDPTRDHPASSPGGDRRTSEKLLAGGAALEASSLQHLLVLLLAHALTALLDERSHEAVTLAFVGGWCETGIGVRDPNDPSSGAGTRTPKTRTKTWRVANYTTPEGHR